MYLGIGCELPVESQSNSFGIQLKFILLILEFNVLHETCLSAE